MFFRYTGFCPDMAHRIGQNYTESTRDAIQEQPHLGGRLGAMRWHDMQKGGDANRSGDGFEYAAYDAMPYYASGYTGHIPTNLWTSCKTDDQRYDNARCPLKAYPLSCSEFGSPCLDNRCSKQGDGYDINMFLNVPHGDYNRNQYHEDNQSSKSCYSSYFTGGKCQDERRSHYPALQQPLKSCCSSCSAGGPCESDQRNVYKLSKQASKACCNSCAQGGVCESDRRSHYPSTKQSSTASYGSYSSGGSHGNSRRDETSRPSCHRLKFREREVKPYRKCGVIPNYMGYIPGLHMTFGEPYGITANRLLQRHFSEQEN
ncbi:hypothetical protein HNY73_016422 [Argiope bruennichi]|uniref:Ciliary microtubule inner protein 2A-C-like domain-containing protein n=1 Tax=Argiope bruennichi TaxID=94029 RepID=A0A8T0EIQ1_ARGBR|nr:hypothetical protein HNY73_016422 [Argiope bruennichi]